ncbi:cell envelope integrity protein TolA [uncultured Shimia sp.]|uniref:cell envelope integrity protein TolA n=1 Tax=uncultured Shimia sp. TaxID=573152 RepID=UPI0025E939C7|nr:TonB family protein [uncultured Shimia sp.]
MIQRSLIIALFATIFSLSLHLLGLGIVGRIEREPSVKAVDGLISISNAFEDIAETLEDPVEPEPDLTPEQEPEQPVQPTPPPSEAEVPDTEVLVASENPQDTYAPDTGTAQIVEPAPLKGTQGEFAPKPDILEPNTPLVESEPVPPQADTAATLGSQTDTVEALTPVVPQASTPQVPIEPVEEVIASLPETSLPVAPIEPAETVTETLPEESPEDKPQPLFPGLRDGFADLRNPSETVESPLETFRREGSVAVGGFGIRSGSAANSRGPGNSDTTNYAGRVLVHLNRTRTVHVKTPGFARVYFEINPDGSLNWVEVIDSSGSSDVDRAARIQIQSAAPFPIPPNGTSRQLSFWYSSG